MERNREGRRGSMAASAATMNGGGPSRRRQQRSNNLRVSPEDGGGGGRVDMYRSSSRSKRRRRTRRGERLVSNRDDGDDSSEESLGEDEEDDDYVRFPTTTSSSVTIQPPPASSSSSSMNQQQNQSHHAGRSFSSKPTRTPAPLSWSVAEELIGVPIPRKVRSSSLKRSQESIGGGGGGGRGGELLINRRQSSTSPASPSPSSNTAMSPSSWNASVWKQKPISGPKHRQPKISKSSSSIQEIEIEVAEVLFGMTRQSPLSSSRQEPPHKLDLKDVNGWSTEEKSGASSPTGSFSPPPAMSQSQLSILPSQNLNSSTNSATAAKRKRPRLQFEKERLATRIEMELLPPKADEGLTSASPLRQEKKMTAVSCAIGNDNIAGSHLQESATQENGNSVLKRKEAEDETTASKSKEASCSNLDEATTNKDPQEEKFSIDLMAPPPPWGNSEREGLSEYLEPVQKLDIMNGEIEKPDKSLKQVATTTTECSSAGEERNARKCMVDDIHSKNKCTTEEKQILQVEQELDLGLEKKDKNGLSLCGSSKGQQQTKQQPEEPQPYPKPSDKNGPSIVSFHPASPQLTMPIAGWPGNFPHFGYMGQVPSLPAVMPMDGSSVTSKTSYPPHFFPPQKRKRCATHCYVAQTIHYNQQIARMNPFWPPAAAGTLPIYGAKPCNLNVMLPSETAILGNLLQGSFPGRSLGQLQDNAASPAVATYAGASAKEKSATAAATNSTLMEAHRKQLLLQQTSHPASAAAAPPPNMLHGPAFIFPTAQQPAAATRSVAAKSNQGICHAHSSAASVSSIAAGSGPSVHPVTSMSINYPTLHPNDAQYLAFLQNNGYPFPTPHVGGGPLPYRGANPVRAMPFFAGSFYSSPMLHPSQYQSSGQQQHPAHSQQGHHNPSTSSGSSSSQEHHSQQSQRALGGAGAPVAPAGGNSHSFPVSKQHLHLLPPLAHQPESEAACEDSPFPADSSRTSQAQKSMYGKFAVSAHPQNFALIAPAAAALPSNGAGGSGCHKEKQQSQQNQANLTPSHAYAMSAAAAASVGAPGIDFSSMVHNQAFFQSLPEAARHHGYQQIAAATAAAAQAAQHKKSHHEDGKSGGDPGTVNANVSCEEGRKMISTSKATGSSAQHSPNFSRPDNEHTISTLPINSSCSTEGSSRNANLMQLLANGGRTSNRSSIAAPASSSAAVTAVTPANPTSDSLNMQLPQQQQLQRHFIQLQKQQLQLQQQMSSRATKKTSSHSTNNALVYSDRMPSGSTMTRFPQGTGFPPSVIQGASAGQSPQWKASGRAVAPGPANSATSTSSSAKNHQLSQQQQQQLHQARTQLQQLQQQQQALLSSDAHQTQISFGLNLSKTVGVSGQTHLAGGSSNSSLTSAGPRQNSVLKSGAGNGGSAGGNGSPGASTSSKCGPATASLLQAVLPMQQPTPAAKNSPSSSSPSLKSPPASNWNMNSILGRSHMTPASTNSSSMTKFQQHSQQKQPRLQQEQSSHQPHLFFSNSFIQAAQSSQSNAATPFADFIQQQHQQRQSEEQSQQQNSLCTSSSLTLASSSATTSDPEKAAAAAAEGMKGLTPVSGAPAAFPCIPAISSSVSVKPSADQKAAAAPGN